MSVHTPTEQVVIVHGPANPDLDAALELAGMAPVITLAHLKVWARTNGPAGIPPGVDAGPQRLLLTVPQAAAALGIGRTTTYQLIRDGAVEAIHVGRCTRIPADTLPDTIARLRTRPTDIAHDERASGLVDRWEWELSLKRPHSSRPTL